MGTEDTRGAIVCKCNGNIDIIGYGAYNDMQKSLESYCSIVSEDSEIVLVNTSGLDESEILMDRKKANELFSKLF